MSDELSVALIDQHLKDLVHWERLALHLEDIVYADIEIIKKENPLVANQRLALFDKWLHKCSKPTLNKLALALEKAEENRLAQQLREHLVLGNSHQQNGKRGEPGSDDVTAGSLGPVSIQQQPTVPVDQVIVNKLVKLHDSFVNIAANFKKELKSLVKAEVVELEDVIMLTKETRPTQDLTFETIDDVTDINMYFRVIFTHYHFLSCHLLVLLAKRFLNSSRVLEDLYQHQKEVLAFKRSVKVTELKQVLEPFVPKSPHETPVTLKVQDAWDEIQLHAVEVLLQTLFRLPHTDVLKIFHVVPGSVIIVYLVPQHIIESLITHSQHNMEFMRLTGIISLQVGETCILCEANNDAGHHEVYGFEVGIMEAVGMDNGEAVKFLMDHVHVAVNIRTQSLHTIELLKKRNLLPMSFSGTVTLLLIAYYCRNTDMIQLLLDNNADPDISVNEGATLLYIACKDGCLKVVEQLLLANANLSIPELTQGATPLFIASQENHLNIVECLLKAKADPNTSKVNGATPLHIACGKGHHEVVEKLIQAKAKPDIQMADGATALFVASQNGYLEIVEMLLQMPNVNPNLPRKDGATPLYIASQGGFTQIVQKLLQAKAMVDIPTIDGATSLHIASELGHLAVVDLLLSADANAEFAMDTGITPLHIASEKGHINVVKKLVQLSANPNSPANDGSTPIYTASRKGHLEVVKTLLQANAVADIPNDNGLTPLFIASREGHCEIVEELLQAKANPDVSNHFGETPLFVACKNGHIEVIKRLLKANADLSSPSLEGVTPLMIANDQGQSKVAELIEHHIISSFK